MKLTIRQENSNDVKKVSKIIDEAFKNKTFILLLNIQKYFLKFKINSYLNKP